MVGSLPKHEKTSPAHFPLPNRLRFAVPQVAGAIPGLAGAALPGLGAAAALPGLARLPGLAPKAEGPVYTGQVVDYNEAGDDEMRTTCTWIKVWPQGDAVDFVWRVFTGTRPWVSATTSWDTSWDTS